MQNTIVFFDDKLDAPDLITSDRVEVETLRLLQKHFKEKGAEVQGFGK